MAIFFTVLLVQYIKIIILFYMPSHVNMGRPSSNSVLLQSLISQLFLRGLDLIASSRFFRQYHVFPMQDSIMCFPCKTGIYFSDFIAGFPWWILGSPRTSMYLFNVKIHDMLSTYLQIFILEHNMLVVKMTRYCCLHIFNSANLDFEIFQP